MDLQTVSVEFLEHLRAQVMIGNRSARTVIAYKQDLAHLISTFGPISLDNIDQRTVDTYYQVLGAHVSKRTGRPLSPHTINKKLRTMRRLFNFCVQRGYMDRVPKIEMVRASVDLEAKTIPVCDFKKILDYARSKSVNRVRDTFILIALGDFGPRSAELATMRIQDIDFGERLVTLTRKGGKIQMVPVSKDFMEALESWLEIRPDTEHDYVLCATNRQSHQPLSPSAVGQAFRRLSNHVLGESWGPHSVRHMWISEMLNNSDSPPKVVRDLAGHESLTTTERYAKEDLSAQRRVIDNSSLLKRLLGKDDDSSKSDDIRDAELD